LSSPGFGDVAGVRLGAVPRRGVVTAHARLSSLIARSTLDHRLLPASRLMEGAERARASLALLGVIVHGEPLISRADLAAEGDQLAHRLQNVSTQVGRAI
jgi:hypothetical protein